MAIIKRTNSKKNVEEKKNTQEVGKENCVATKELV